MRDVCVKANEVADTRATNMTRRRGEKRFVTVPVDRPWGGVLDVDASSPKSGVPSVGRSDGMTGRQVTGEPYCLLRACSDSGVKTTNRRFPSCGHVQDENWFHRRWPTMCRVSRSWACRVTDCAVSEDADTLQPRSGNKDLSLS